MNIVKELSAKVSELERKLNSEVSNTTLDVFQNKSIISSFVDGAAIHTLGEINADASGQTILQVLVQIRSEIINSVNVKLWAGEMLLYDSDRALAVGDNEIFLMTTFMMAKGESADVVLEVSPLSELTNYLSSATLYLWSASLSAKTTDTSVLNADLSEDRLCVSLVVDRKIYNYTTNNIGNLDFSEFDYYADGIASDCVLVNSDNGEVRWFRLAGDNTLYMSESGNVQNEVVVARNVSSFSVSAYSERMGILVCFIRDGLPYYMTIENNVFSSEFAFNVNKTKKYKSICTLKSNSSYVYVVISTENGSNLLFDVAPEFSFGSKSYDRILISSTMNYA